MLSAEKKGHITDLIGYSGIFIGPEVLANGKINTEEDVYIDGDYKGEIVSSGAIELGKNSLFHGKIKARSVVIEGRVKADILADDSIHISGCGHLYGTVEAKNVSVDPGAMINAKVKTK